MADRREVLRRAGLFNARADKVRSPLFRHHPFFDPCDRLQVKYEMLRSHGVDGLPIRHAAEMFGFSRQGFYQLQAAFRAGSLAGLFEKKRGRKGPVKCTPDVVAFIVSTSQAHPELSAGDLGSRLERELGIAVHRRTIEKLLSGRPRPRRKKKPRSTR
jgi:transposase